MHFFQFRNLDIMKFLKYIIELRYIELIAYFQYFFQKSNFYE